jgi:hypothetical protein
MFSAIEASCLAIDRGPPSPATKPPHFRIRQPFGERKTDAVAIADDPRSHVRFRFRMETTDGFIIVGSLHAA